MSTWASADLEANGLRLHYTRTGGAKPPLVLTHGFSDDGLCWTPVAESLAAAYDVIMLDARGHGRSDGPEEGYGPKEHAADVAGLITGLGLEKPAVLGHSMGAVTALALAGLYPTLPGQILLEDPPAVWLSDAPPLDPAARRQRFWSWIVNLKRKTGEEMLAAQRAESPHWSEAELGPWVAAKLRLSFFVLTATQSEVIDWPTTIAQISCPVLLITADPAQGAIVTAAGAAQLQATLPQVQVAHIANAGHSIRRDQFGPYMRVVEAFLADK